MQKPPPHTRAHLKNSDRGLGGGKRPVHVHRALRVAAFLLLGSIIFWCLYAQGAPHYYAERRQRISDVVAHPEGIEAAVWGSSHAQCIRFDAMGLRGENFYTVSQDIFGTSHSARTLSRRMPELKLALLSLSYFSFYFDNGRYRKGDVPAHAGIRVRMYATYPKTLSFIPGDGSSYLKGLLHPLVTVDHWESVLAEPGKSLPEAKVTKRGPITPLDINEERRKNKNAKSKKPPEEHRIYALKRCKYLTETITGMKAHNPEAPEMALEAAVDTVEELRARGIRVVFFTAPYYKAFNDCYPAELKQGMYAYAAKLVERTSVEYYDFARDPEFEDVPKMFINADHLNGRGARLLSLRIKELMDAASR